MNLGCGVGDLPVSHMLLPVCDAGQRTSAHEVGDIFQLRHIMFAFLIFSECSVL